MAARTEKESFSIDSIIFGLLNFNCLFSMHTYSSWALNHTHIYHRTIECINICCFSSSKIDFKQQRPIVDTKQIFLKYIYHSLFEHLYALC